MPSRTAVEIKVADEVWIATALLHREQPDREDFSVEEIVARATRAGLTDKLRPGVYVHALQHCVANRAPAPGRYSMLYETGRGRRRLWRPGDRIDPKRVGAKTIPLPEDIPAKYRGLIEWYASEYAGLANHEGSQDPILSLRGVGKAIWKGEHPDNYVRKLREGW